LIKFFDIDIDITNDAETANTYPTTPDPRMPIAHTSDRANTHATHPESHEQHDQESFCFVCCELYG
jgi:hypothetical protein